MPPCARHGVDDAFNPADSHGKPCCPHPVKGPGTSGSPDIRVNGQQPMRVGDPGMHSACCGPNTWVSAQGSGTVYFNNIPVSRQGDQTTHCGGTGAFIAGSGDVIIGG